MEGDKPTRSRILNIAGALFAEQGFHAVSMRAIAKAADLSLGALYSHFESKDEIYATIVARAQEVFIERMAEREGPSPDLAEWLRFAFEYYGEHRELLKLEAWARLEGILRDDQSPVRRAFLSTVLELQERGTVRRDIRPEIVWSGFRGALERIVFEADDNATGVEDWLTLLTEGILPKDEDTTAPGH